MARDAGLATSVRNLMSWPSLSIWAGMHGPRATRALEGTSSRSTDDLFELGELARSPSLKRALAAVRDFLGMDLAFATEFIEDKQVFRALVGNGGSFGFHEGLEVPLDQTYCQRVLSGRLPNLITGAHSWAVVDRAASVARQLGLGEAGVTDVKQVPSCTTSGRSWSPRRSSPSPAR